ncbi:MAG: oligopeptide:H+ symporter [Gammaproteobacteria bacterium]|nr:oligopeptide:H+ symporter [Gammaproteobacteria bacterium]
MTHTDAIPRPQPRKAFLVLFFVEVWERFGYYGMASLMVLYMVERLDLGDAQADLIWGAFSALVYSMPMLGGYVGDRVLGARRTLVLGAITLGLGYLLLSVPLTATFFPAMGLIALGNGLFKVNPNNLASRLYEGDHSRLDILFTLYYTSLNIGSFVSILLTPWIKDHPAWSIDIGGLHFDSWHLAFGLSAIGLTLGLLNYGVFQHYLRPYGTAPDFRKLHWRKLAAVIAVSLLIAFMLAEIIRYRAAALAVVGLLLLLTILIFARLLTSGDQSQRRRVIACMVFTFMAAIWAIYNQQIYTSLTLFALRNVNHELLGMHVAPAQFQDLNQFWLVVLAGPLAWFYQRMHRSARGDFSIATKYAFGLYLLALAFLLYAASGFSARAGVVSPWWLVAGYAAQSLGELLISALGFSMVSQLVPERVRGIVMGAWFLGMGVSNYAGGAIAGIAHFHAGMTLPTESLPVYMHLFGGLGLAALICALAATAAIPLLKSLVGQGRDYSELLAVSNH